MSAINLLLLKGRVHWFSMQVVMNKCFLLNPEKKIFLAQIRLVVFENTQKNHTLIPKNDVTEPKARLPQYPLKLLTGEKSVSGFRKPWFPKVW